MPRKTLHCPDDEPLRHHPCQNHPGRLTHTRQLVTLDDGVITSTSANMLALKRLQCMGHLFVARCIHNFTRQSPTESLSTNRAPLYRLSLCRSLGGAYIARPTHCRSRISKFLAIRLSRHSTLSRSAWKAVPKLATTYFLLLLSPHTKLGAQVTVGRSGSSRNVTHPHICSHLQKKTKCSVSLSVRFSTHKTVLRSGQEP